MPYRAAVHQGIGSALPLLKDTVNWDTFYDFFVQMCAMLISDSLMKITLRPVCTTVICYMLFYY